MTSRLEPPSRVAFLGTPEIAVPFLTTVVESGTSVPLVVSRADARRGRRSSPTPSPVKAAAIELGLAVTDDLDVLADTAVDMAIVVAYGRIIPARLLDLMPMVNVHFSLLPRWRGAAPVERAILAGDTMSGVCVMEVAEGLDEGAVHGCVEVPIGPRSTADDLRADLVSAGRALLARGLSEGFDEPVAQSGEVTYAEKLKSADLRLDWHRSAVELDRVVRVGGAWTELRGARLKVWDADPIESADAAWAGPPGTLVGVTVACGEGALVLREVQVEGKARTEAAAWRSGARVDDGTVLGG